MIYSQCHTLICYITMRLIIIQLHLSYICQRIILMHLDLKKFYCILYCFFKGTTHIIFFALQMSIDIAAHELDSYSKILSKHRTLGQIIFLFFSIGLFIKNRRIDKRKKRHNISSLILINAYILVIGNRLINCYLLFVIRP